MTKRQLIALFICNFVPPALGTAFLGLLPVYLARLGADSAQTGFYLAFTFLCLAISTIVGGRLSDRFQRRKALLIAGGVLGIPCAFFMSAATTIPALMLLMALLWFASGIVVTMVNILAGLFAEEHERGQVFGILGLGIPLSGVLTGIISGPIVDRWGFQALFVFAALLYICVPVAGFFLKDKVVTPLKREGASPSLRMIFTNRTFTFLFFASIIAHIANSQIILSRPLIMDSFHFDATAIASTGAVGGLATLPLPILVGWLSDRLGRKPFLILCYLATIAGLIVLLAAFDLWHFWTASALQSALVASLVVGSALITDIFPKEILGASLALFNATPWIGFVVGFGGTGASMNTFGTGPTLLSGVLLTLTAIVLLIPIQKHQIQYPIEVT